MHIIRGTGLVSSERARPGAGERPLLPAARSPKAEQAASETGVELGAAWDYGGTGNRIANAASA